MRRVLLHVLRINLLIQKTHACDKCADGFWIGIGIESKWDWFHNK